MSSDDIANLYRQFGGKADQYQELGRDNVVKQSRERWPLLSQVRAQDAQRAVRPVRPGEDGTPPPGDAPLPTVFDEDAAAAERLRAAQAAAPRQPAPVVPPATAPAPAAALPDTLPPAGPVRIEPALGAAPGRPVTVTATATAADGTELQQLFSRLSRPAQPPATPADRDTSLLRRLLKP